MFGCHLGSTVCAKDTVNLLLIMMKSQNIALCVHPTVI